MLFISHHRSILPWLLVVLPTGVVRAGPEGNCPCSSGGSLSCVQVGIDQTCLCNGVACDYASCCQRRRLLTTASGGTTLWSSPEDTEYQEFLHRCGDMDYETSLYVDTHLYAIASPAEQAVAEGCPFVVAHSVFEEDCGGDEVSSPGNHVRKELLVWKDQKTGESLFPTEGLLSFGTFKASDLAYAYETAEAGHPGATYDVITNNCGDFVVNLASLLGIKIDARVTSFVARRLVAESGKALVERIRNSMHYNSLFSSGQGRHLAGGVVDEQQVVEQLVQSKASELYNSS